MPKSILVSLLLLSGLFFSCDSEKSRFDINTNGIELDDLKIKRYETALFEIDKNNIKAELIRLRDDYPVFLEGDFNNPFNIERIQNFIEDTLLQRVYLDCSLRFSEISALEHSLTNAFKHYIYYYPEDALPEVYTYVSGFDYKHPVQYFDRSLLIALDMYLGVDYPNYLQLGIPKYVLQKFQAQSIPRDCMFQMALSKIKKQASENELLSMMVQQGKLLWFVKAMLPDISDEVLFNYTAEQKAWIENNEVLVWAFIIENEMLYQADLTINQKFIYDSPFTSFFGNDSPPRLGWWIGFRIVESYMDQNENMHPSELFLNSNSAEILKKSKFKPE
ncbi:MAG: hypothetical protein K9H49_14255 [Bacteroidales bacterium]|nr:hypothetical protein [Bacteroidales bacterium]